MQRIEFIKKLEEVTQRLKSEKIESTFREGFNQPAVAYNYDNLKPVLFESKSQFDQLMLDEQYKPFLEQINGIEIYDEKFMASLTSVLRQTRAADILINKIATSFYSFHSSLTDLVKITNSLLTNRLISNTNEENLEAGVVLFQVKIDAEGLATSSYVKIFTALEELAKTIEKAFKLEPTDSEIIMLDSGSDSNIGFETKVEIAKSIFQIFKEIWDFITSLKFYRTQQRNQVLLDSLTIRKELLKSAEEGIITDDEAKEYIHIIKTRTDALIGMNVLPRALTHNGAKIDNSKILEEYRLKVLEENTEQNAAANN